MEFKVLLLEYIDPWKWASLQGSNKNIKSVVVVNCDDCAHCVDLKAPNKNDPK